MKFINILILFIFLGFLTAKSDNFNKDLLPELFSPSNSGTEFAVSLVPAYYAALDEYNMVRVYFSSATSAKVNFKISKFFIDTTINIEANKVSEYSIHAKYLMPFNKTPNQVTPIENNYEGRALMIKSDVPIIVYVLVRLRTYTEGFLALPINFLSTDYNLSTFKDHTNNKSSFSPSTAVIVSSFDNTRVTFKLGGTNTTRIKLENGDSLYPANSVRKVLNEGDVWVVPGFGLNNDLSGSTIRSNKPVTVYTGNYCAQVPTGQNPCEYLIEQELPTIYFAQRYYITPIFGRTKGSWIKVNSFEENTEVKLNNQKKGTIQFPYGVEDEGFLSFRVNEDNKLAIISSDKRINVTQYNTGNESNDDKGVPFKMQALSYHNFSKKIVFQLPATSQNSHFSDNYLNIVFKLNKEGKIPDDLLLTEINDKGISTKKIKELTADNPIQFPITEPDGSRMFCLTLKLAKYGRYIINSSNPVGAVFYGLSSEDAYGSPAYIYMKNIDKLTDTLAPKVEIEEGALANYYGNVTDEPESNVKVRSNLALIHLINDSSYNYVLTCEPFIPGVDSKATFQLRPINIKENALAYVRIVDFAGNDTIIKFSYSNEPVPPKIIFKKFTNPEFCPGNPIDVEFSINNGSFLGENTFFVKLAKINPDKPTYPITLAQVKSSLISKISTTIPRQLVGGDDYFIYIETTYPQIRSDSVDLTILELPQHQISGYKKVCKDNIFKYYTNKSVAKLKWQVKGGEIIGNDDLDTVKINWNKIDENTLSLTLSTEKCSETLEYIVNVGDDITNSIEGINKSCRMDSVFYNSFLSTGKFEWQIKGGKILGDSRQQMIRVVWLETGIANLKLIYTSDNGFIKEFEYDVAITELPEKPTISRENRVLISSSTSGNQWYYEGNIIQGARAKTYDTKDVEGKYYVIVTLDGCSSEKSEIYDYKILSVKYSNNSEYLKLYPNPVKDNLNIIFNRQQYDKTIFIKIYDFKNSLIDIIQIEPNSDEMININYPTSKLSSGYYFINILLDSEFYFDKFIINK